VSNYKPAHYAPSTKPATGAGDHIPLSARPPCVPNDEPIIAGSPPTALSGNDSSIILFHRSRGRLWAGNTFFRTKGQEVKYNLTSIKGEYSGTDYILTVKYFDTSNPAHYVPFTPFNDVYKTHVVEFENINSYEGKSTDILVGTQLQTIPISFYNSHTISLNGNYSYLFDTSWPCTNCGDTVALSIFWEELITFEDTETLYLNTRLLKIKSVTPQGDQILIECEQEIEDCQDGIVGYLGTVFRSVKFRIVDIEDNTFTVEGDFTIFEAGTHFTHNNYDYEIVSAEPIYPSNPQMAVITVDKTVVGSQLGYISNFYYAERHIINRGFEVVVQELRCGDPIGSITGEDCCTSCCGSPPGEIYEEEPDAGEESGTPDCVPMWSKQNDGYILTGKNACVEMGYTITVDDPTVSNDDPPICCPTGLREDGKCWGSPPMNGSPILHPETFCNDVPALCTWIDCSVPMAANLRELINTTSTIIEMPERGCDYQDNIIDTMGPEYGWPCNVGPCIETCEDCCENPIDPRTNLHIRTVDGFNAPGDDHYGEEGYDCVKHDPFYEPCLIEFPETFVNGANGRPCDNISTSHIRSGPSQTACFVGIRETDCGDELIADLIETFPFEITTWDGREWSA